MFAHKAGLLISLIRLARGESLEAAKAAGRETEDFVEELEVEGERLLTQVGFPARCAHSLCVLRAHPPGSWHKDQYGTSFLEE